MADGKPTLSMSPMTETDLPHYTTVEQLAFDNTIFNRAMWPTGLTPTDISMLTARHAKSLTEDKNCHLMKVTARVPPIRSSDGASAAKSAAARGAEDGEEEEEEEVVGIAEWHRTPHRSQAELEKPREWPEWTPSANVPAKKHLFKNFLDRRDAIMGGDPHWVLMVLAVKPEWQGKGVGTQLLKWGMERADAEEAGGDGNGEKTGWPCFLEASVAGRPLYEKYGFVKVADVVTDLTPFGVEGVPDVHTTMRREAKART
jgi:GNAT superfamily N-acetyltransferase